MNWSDTSIKTDNNLTGKLLIVLFLTHWFWSRKLINQKQHIWSVKSTSCLCESSVMTSLPVWVQANAAHSLKLVISGELCWYELWEVLKTEPQGSSESWFQTADRTMVMIYCQITSDGGDTWLNPTFRVFQPTQNLINSCSLTDFHLSHYRWHSLWAQTQAWHLKHLSDESWPYSHSFELITILSSPSFQWIINDQISYYTLLNTLFTKS